MPELAEGAPRRGVDAAVFAAHRAVLFGIAYRMLGSTADAEDVVQDAWIRSVQAEDIREPRAFLSTVVVRLCLDRLGSAQARREVYVGPWLPEPLVGTAIEPSDPGSLSTAFLVLCEALSPLERAAFLLHDVFDWTHAEIAKVLERDDAAVRQLAARARAHLEDGRPRFAPSPEAHRLALESFVMTIASGDTEALARLLSESAEVHSDGGGKVRAARKVVRGATDAALLLVGITKKNGVQGTMEAALVNGSPGLIWRAEDGACLGTLQIETDGQRIHKVFLVVSPEKLRAIPRARA